ncbi:hypothetical protein D3C74_414410 [compost metagenome]
MDELFLDCLERPLIEADQIHLVHSQYEMLDPHQGADPGMAFGLGNDAFGSVHQNDG